MHILRSRSLGVIVVVACAAAGLFYFANPATSQSGPDADCSGDVVATLVTTGFGDRVNRIYSFTDNDHLLTEFTVEIPPMPAGTYAVNAVSYDGYTGRAAAPAQPNEVWTSNLLAADGTVLASTGATPDLADGVEEVTWAGSLGTISWSGPDAVGLQFVHSDLGGDIPNSVSPSCVGFELDTPIQPKAICVPADADDDTCEESPVSRTPDEPIAEPSSPVVEPVITIAQVPDPLPSSPAFTG